MTYHELLTAQREAKKMSKTFFTIDYRDWSGLDRSCPFHHGGHREESPHVIQAVVTGDTKGSCGQCRIRKKPLT